MRVGDMVTVKVDYPKNKKMNGIWTGRVTEVGCFRSGYAYFKLDGIKYAFPNSSRYSKVIDRRVR